jgi:hypothetical protein
MSYDAKLMLGIFAFIYLLVVAIWMISAYKEIEQLKIFQSLWCLYRFINHQASSLLSSVNIFMIESINLLMIMLAIGLFLVFRHLCSFIDKYLTTIKNILNMLASISL